MHNYDQLIDLVGLNANNPKIQSNFTDQPKKKINDEITISVNKYLANNNKIDDFLYQVTNVFGDMDICDLIGNGAIPQTRKTIPIYDPLNNDLNHLQFAPDINGLNGFLTFKGGALIKYNIIKKYLSTCLAQHIITINEPLNTNIYSLFDMGGIINTYSDLDFSYNIYHPGRLPGIGNISNHEYENLLKNLMRRMHIFRENIRPMVQGINIPLIIQNTRNISLHSNIQTFFENEDIKLDNGVYTQVTRIVGTGRNNITYDTNIQISNNVKNMFICRNMRIPPGGAITGPLLYELNEGFEQLAISFNNTVLTNNQDFDLFRIKVAFDVNNNYNQMIFLSEFFDLSVLRCNDIRNQHMNDHFNQYTEIINTQNTAGINFSIRAYSVYYLLLDILGVMFEQNNMYPWHDKKYEKRVIRLSFLINMYIDEMHLNIDNMYTNMFIMLYLMAFIKKIYNLRHNINILNPNDYLLDIMMEVFMEMINIVLVATNDYNKLDDLYNFINSCYGTIISPGIDSNILLNILYNGIHGRDGLIAFVFIYIILFYYKLFIVKDVAWCDIINNNRQINLIQYQMKYIIFVRSFANSFFLSMLCQNRLLNINLDLDRQTRLLREQIDELHGGNITKLYVHNLLKKIYNNLNKNKIYDKEKIKLNIEKSIEYTNKFKQIIDLHNELFNPAKNDAITISSSSEPSKTIKLINPNKYKKPKNSVPTKEDVKTFSEILKTINYFTENIFANVEDTESTYKNPYDIDDYYENMVNYNDHVNF